MPAGIRRSTPGDGGDAAEPLDEPARGDHVGHARASDSSTTARSSTSGATVPTSSDASAAPAAHRQRQQRRPDPDGPPARHLDRHAARRGGTVEHPPGDPAADGHEHEPRQPRPVDADAGQFLAGELDARAAGEPRGRGGRVEHAQRAAQVRGRRPRPGCCPAGAGGTSAASSGARNVDLLHRADQQRNLRGAPRRDLDVQRQARRRVGPHVDPPHGGVGVGRGEPQPGRDPPGDPAGGQRRDGVVGREAQQAPAQLGRQQVGRPRQPQRGVPGQRRELVEPEVPDVLAAVEVVDVTLADGGQLVGPPAVGARDVAADAGDAGEERRRRLQRRQLRQRDPPGRLGQPDPRLRSAVEDPPSQVGHVVGLCGDGQGVEHAGDAGHRHGSGGDQQPAPAQPPAAQPPPARPRHAAPRCHRHRVARVGARVGTDWPANVTHGVARSAAPNVTFRGPELPGQFGAVTMRSGCPLARRTTPNCPVRRARTGRRSFWHSPGPSAHLDWGQAMRGGAGERR